MPRHSGTGIKSPLFALDPLSKTDSPTDSIVTPVERKFITKGDGTNDLDGNKNTINSYEHIGGQDDSFIVNTDTGSYHLHRAVLKESLIELKEFATITIKELTPNANETFRSVVEALRLLYGSQALYDIILTDIRTIFSDVKEIIPGTVSAFFIGCFATDKFPGEPGCDPKCTGSLPQPKNILEKQTCDELVLIYENEMFGSLNDKRSPLAFIYIGQPDFTVFTHDNIRQLKSAGVERAILVMGNPDGSYREVTSEILVDNLPVPKLKAQETTSSTSSSNTAAIVVLIIVIILIVLALLMLFYRPKYFQ